MRFHNAEGMLARWLEELSQYDMVIQHHPGKNMEMQMVYLKFQMRQNSAAAIVMDFKRRNKSQTSGIVVGIKPGVAQLRVPHTTTIPRI